MKINLSTEKGIQKLQDTLDTVQAKSRTRTVTAEEIKEAAKALLDSIPATKKSMAGVKATLDLNAQDFPNAYKGIPESTKVDLEFTTTGHWVVTDVYRGHCSAVGHKADVIYTDAAKESILESMTHFRYI